MLRVGMCDVGCKSVAARFRGSDGGHDDRGDLVALAHAVGQPLTNDGRPASQSGEAASFVKGQLGGWDDAGFDKEFEPIGRLVSLGLPSSSPSVLDDGVHGLELFSLDPPAIPAVSTWGLTVLTLSEPRKRLHSEVKQAHGRELAA